MGAAACGGKKAPYNVGAGKNARRENRAAFLCGARRFFVGGFSCGGCFFVARLVFLCGGVCAVVDSSVGGCKRKAPAFCRAFVLI